MPRVRLIHWNGPEGRERKLRLASLGFEADFDDAERTRLTKVLRVSVPDAYLIDLTRLPSSGREVAMWLRSNKSTRHVPIVFVDGDPAKVAKLKALLPDATYTSWSRLKTALPKAIANPAAQPVIPPSVIYTGRSTGEKLGLKPELRVALGNAPKDFVDSLRPIPKGVRFSARLDESSDLWIVFVRSRRELFAQLGTLAPRLERQTLWIAWPKKASGIKSDIDGNLVRTTGLESGLVDFKVCAIDETWSGLAFKKKRPRPTHRVMRLSP